MAEEYLRVENISKCFGKTKVLDGISLEVFKGEFISILGNSGCGKTTLLRIIAGLETPDDGKVLLDGTDITEFPPEKRMLNMVFQNYALFEHMTVKENVGYSLKFLQLSKEERENKIRSMLETVGLSGREDRMPSQLSGGQRQRVALARAIINEPKLLLLDEPLGALDRNLRKKMQTELKDLQKRLGITFLYITHDLEEAVFLSDRIAVIDRGRFAEVNDVDGIMNSQNPFVRDFMGDAVEKEI